MKKYLHTSQGMPLSRNMIRMQVPSEIPDPSSWQYYGFNHGRHIGFHSQ